MKISSKEKTVLKLLLQEAKTGNNLPSTDFIAGQLGWSEEQTKNRCHSLRAHGLIGPNHETILCSITSAGRDQLKSWWGQHIVLIVAVAALIVATLSLIVALWGGHDLSDQQKTEKKNESHKVVGQEK